MRICWSGFSKTNKGSEFVLTIILTIYRSGLRGNYGLCGTEKHGKARKKRQKTDAFTFGTSMLQIRVLSLRPKSELCAQKTVLIARLGLFFVYHLQLARLSKDHSFLQNAFFRHKTPVLQIFKAIFEAFFENSFSLLSATQILRADRLISASPLRYLFL